MTRTAAREIAVRLCYSMSENPVEPAVILEDVFEPEYYATLASEDEVFSAYPDLRQMEYISRIVTGIGEHNAELSAYIEKYAVGWKFSRISRTALAIMKTAMFEVLYMPEIPPGASINEAVELSKRYEEPDTVPFINGVLGSFIRGEVKE